MHEMALAEGMLDIVEDVARTHGASRIAAIHLELGRLSPVMPEALRFCFEVVSKATLAEGARLEIEDLPGEGWCMPCGAPVPMNALTDSCPRCGSAQLTVTGGDTMRVKDIAIA